MRKTATIAAAILPLALAGCALWPRPLAPVHYYAIEPAATARPAPKPAQGVLAVHTLASASRYRERILWRQGTAAANYHEYRRWVEPPAEMVTTALRRALEAARVAETVVDERLVRRPDFLLDGRLARFDELHGRDAWAAVCEIEIVLKQADNGSVLAATRLAATHAAEARTTDAFVQAMNAAVADVAAQAAKAVAKALAAQKQAK